MPVSGSYGDKPGVIKSTPGSVWIDAAGGFWAGLKFGGATVVSQLPFGDRFFDLDQLGDEAGLDEATREWTRRFASTGVAAGTARREPAENKKRGSSRNDFKLPSPPASCGYRIPAPNPPLPGSSLVGAGRGGLALALFSPEAGSGCGGLAR